jgi:hypothetical protein
MNKYFRVAGSTFQKLEEHGVSASAVLRRAGLSQAYISEPRVLLKTEELFALWRAKHCEKLPGFPFEIKAGIAEAVATHPPEAAEGTLVGFVKERQIQDRTPVRAPRR